MTAQPMQPTPPGTVFGPDGRPFARPSEMALPPWISFAGIFSNASRTYFHQGHDEALQMSREDALAMRRDPFLMGLLQERKLAVSSLPWHLEVPDEKNPRERQVRDTLTKIVRSTFGLRRIFWALLDAIWYGRAGCEVTFVYRPVDGLRGLHLDRFSPINGDKLGWCHGERGEPDTPYVAINAARERDLVGQAETVTTTQGGKGVLLKGSWRERFLLHRHEIQDADFFSGREAGRIQGVGVRDGVAWLNWIRLEYSEWIASYMERVGCGVNLWHYDAGNPNSFEEAKRAARDNDRRVNLFVPTWMTKDGPKGGLERLETPVAGVDALQKLIGQMCEEKIQRYIVGQDGSASARGSGGLGNEASAQFMQETKGKITAQDAVLLGESLTGCANEPGLLSMMQYWTFRHDPALAALPVRWIFDVERTQSKEKLEAAKTCWEMGIDLKADEVRAAAGFSKPGDDDEVIAGKQEPLPGMGLPGMPGMPGETPPGQAPGESPPPQPPGGPQVPAPKPPVAGPVRHAKEKSGGGHWITIGGSKDEDGKRHGGSPVYVENGRITKGAPSLTGKKVEALKEKGEGEGKEHSVKPLLKPSADDDPSTHRQQLHREKDYQRAVWAKKARQEGMDPKALHQLAGEALAHDKELVEGRKRLLQDARKQLAHYGYDARALTTNLRSGRVEDNIPNLDIVADSLAANYPEHFGGTEEPAERLKEMLTEGNPQPMSEDDAYSQAFDHLVSGSGESNEDFGFGANGEEEPLPFARYAEGASSTATELQDPATYIDALDFLTRRGLSQDEALAELRRLAVGIQPELERHTLPLPIRYAARHAPEGGVTIAGTLYPGGEFIPGEVMEKASPAEKVKVEGVARTGPLADALHQHLSSGGIVRLHGYTRSNPADFRLRDDALQVRMGPLGWRTLDASDLQTLTTQLPGAAPPVLEEPAKPATPSTATTDRMIARKVRAVDPRSLEPVNDTDFDKVDRLAQDMTKNGWVGMPLVAVDDQALTGSHRLKAAEKAGLKEIPVVSVSREEIVQGARKAGFLDKSQGWEDLRVADEDAWLSILEATKNKAAAEIMRREVEHNQERGRED